MFNISLNFSLIINNWLSLENTFQSCIKRAIFFLGENLALKKPSLQSSASDTDQTSFAPTLAVDGGKYFILLKINSFTNQKPDCCYALLRVRKFKVNITAAPGVRKVFSGSRSFDSTLGAWWRYHCFVSIIPDSTKYEQISLSLRSQQFTKLERNVL